MAAADSLASIGAAAAPALTPLVAGTDVQARDLATRAVATCGPAATIAAPALVPALGAVVRRGPDDRAFPDAVRALTSIGPAAAPAAGALAAVLDDPNAFNGWRGVLEALAALGPAARPVLPSVLRKLDASSGTTDAVRNAAALAAGRLGGPAALAALTRELLAPAGPSRRRPADTVAIALGSLGPEGRAALARAAAADAAALRHAAIAGYTALGVAGVPGLTSMLAEARPCTFPYGELGSLNDAVLCRAEAAAALGVIGRPAAAALPALERLLGDAPDAGTQDAARRAIARIRR